MANRSSLTDAINRDTQRSKSPTPGTSITDSIHRGGQGVYVVTMAPRTLHNPGIGRTYYRDIFAPQ